MSELTELALARREIAAIKERIDQAENAQELEFLSTKLKIAYMTESAAQERELFTKKASITSDSAGDHPATVSGGKGLSALPSHFDTFKNYDFDKAENKATLSRDLAWIDQAMRLHYGKSPELNTHGPRQLVILLGPQNSMSIANIVAKGATWAQTMELLMALHAKEGRQELVFKTWKELEFFPGLESVEQYIKRYLSATKENFTVEKFDWAASPFLGAHFAETMPASIKKALDMLIQMDKQTKLAQAEQQQEAERQQEAKAELDTSTSASADASQDASTADPLQLIRMRVTLRPITLSAYFGFLRSLATGPDYGSYRRSPKEVNFVEFHDLDYYKLPGATTTSASRSRSASTNSVADKPDKTQPQCTQDPCRHLCTFHHSNSHTTADCTKMHKDHADKTKLSTIGQQDRVPPAISAISISAGAARPPVPSTARPPTPHRSADRDSSPPPTRTSPRDVPRVDYSNSGAGKYGSKKLALLQSYDPSIQELALVDGEEYGFSSDDNPVSSDEEDNPIHEDADRSFVAMLTTDDSHNDLPPLITTTRFHPATVSVFDIHHAMTTQPQTYVPDLFYADDGALVTDQ